MNLKKLYFLRKIYNFTNKETDQTYINRPTIWNFKRPSIIGIIIAYANAIRLDMLLKSNKIKFHVRLDCFQL